MCLKQIVSGGQTGADRAALDAAIATGFPHGGWCPAERRSEEGPITHRYRLKETPSGDYRQRTEWNVRDSDGTIVLTLRDSVSGGSRQTITCAEKLDRPVAHIRLDARKPDRALHEMKQFIHDHQIQILNVAGPRESTEPGIYGAVSTLIKKLLQPSGNP